MGRWKHGVQIPYILRDKNNDFVMVNMIKFVNTKGTFFKMDTATYHQLLVVAEEYQVSVQKRSNKQKVFPTLSNSYLMKMKLMQRMKAIQLLVWTEHKGKQEQTNCKMSYVGQNGDVD